MADEQEKSTFIISIKPSSELERLSRPTAFRRTPEEKTILCKRCFWRFWFRTN